tara:strand:+ start:429 stop:983 length:555 start_codon:yes stop_codon:yes gene_type:complete
MMLLQRISIIILLAIICGSNAKKFRRYRNGRRALAFVDRGRSKPSSYHHSRCLKSTSSTAIVDQVWTLDDLQDFAKKEGVELSKTNIGPAFRTVARSTHNSSKILGYGEGFVRPTGNILHLDKMEVFKPMLKQVRKENPDFRGGGTIFGVGLLFGYQCLLHGTFFCDRTLLKGMMNSINFVMML